MKSILLFFILSLSCYSQKTEKVCDTETLIETEKNINILSEKEITAFCKSYGKECQNNVEFSEFHNELLFKIAEKHTQKLLNSLLKISDENKLLILEEFKTNVAEINIEKLKKKIKSCRGNETLKKELITAISKNT